MDTVATISMQVASLPFALFGAYSASLPRFVDVTFARFQEHSSVRVRHGYISGAQSRTSTTVDHIHCAWSTGRDRPRPHDIPHILPTEKSYRIQEVHRNDHTPIVSLTLSPAPIL